RRAMHPDGSLILTVPNGRGPFELQAWVWRNFVARMPLYDSLRSLRARDVSQAAFLNDESPHVNFFTWKALRRLVTAVGMEISDYQGRTFLCGPMFSPLFFFPGAESINAWLGDYLPRATVSDWMFVLKNRR